MRSVRSPFHSRGFTLLEVLVALAVLAIALGALIKAASQSVDNIAYLRDRTIATWVASNKVDELMLQAGWPRLGVTYGVSHMAGREWRWQLRVSNTVDGDMRRLQVAVAINQADPVNLAELAAFKGRP